MAARAAVRCAVRGGPAVVAAAAAAAAAAAPRVAAAAARRRHAAVTLAGRTRAVGDPAKSPEWDAVRGRIATEKVVVVSKNSCACVVRRCRCAGGPVCDPRAPHTHSVHARASRRCWPRRASRMNLWNWTRSVRVCLLRKGCCLVAAAAASRRVPGHDDGTAENGYRVQIGLLGMTGQRTVPQIFVGGHHMGGFAGACMRAYCWGRVLPCTVKALLSVGVRQTSRQNG